MSAAAHSDVNDPFVLKRTADSVATLTLNRPKQFNVLSEGMLAALEDAIRDVAVDDNIKVVVIGAEGRAFCAGHDLKEMRTHPDQAYYNTLFERCSALMTSLTALPKPVIAKVQGIATAAGCQLVAACDLAVATEDAQFAVSGVNLGLFCSTPSVALARNVARKKAFEMLVTGDFIDAHTALEYGLINRVVARDALTSAIDALTATIANKPLVALKTGKEMFYRQLEMPLADAYQLAGQAMACNMMAPDTVEGIDAFIEKRAPAWRKD